ncbi:hypothetical protein KFK09_018371 [Dendrobium nobile]|uniref:Uncharacterized protein n=1 Tax=Dendrobium nobile TaxID=94219 RepID=A0A8T3AWT2_DENNO|nr:hypothetical protein KFK09_018371 [Dendrobium nobile]
MTHKPVCPKDPSLATPRKFRVAHSSEPRVRRGALALAPRESPASRARGRDAEALHALARALHPTSGVNSASCG